MTNSNYRSLGISSCPQLHNGAPSRANEPEAPKPPHPSQPEGGSEMHPNDEPGLVTVRRHGSRVTLPEALVTDPKLTAAAVGLYTRIAERTMAFVEIRDGLARHGLAGEPDYQEYIQHGLARLDASACWWLLQGSAQWCADGVAEAGRQGLQTTLEALDELLRAGWIIEADGYYEVAS